MHTHKFGVNLFLFKKKKKIKKLYLCVSTHIIFFIIQKEYTNSDHDNSTIQ